MASRVPRHNSRLRPPISNSALFLKKAMEFNAAKNLPKAFEFFVKYFESVDQPDTAPPSAQIAFTKVVCEIGVILEDTNNVEELLKCYLQAINIFPDNYIILNNLGGYMFKIGELDIARRYLESALKANRNYLPAEKNLLYVKWHQLPRWHFRMLNDKQRNLAYASAIKQVIEEGYTNVYDIGAGCGLLSLIAAQNSQANVTAIEENKTLFKMCSAIATENNASNIRLLHCNSNDLITAPSPCNLIITEIFDVALFGERAIESLAHAIKTLVTYRKFKTIPASADLYVTGIYNKYLISRYRVIHDVKSLKLGNICIRQLDPEPYEAEYLMDPHLKVQYLTETTKFGHIEFTDADQLNEILNNEFSETISLVCTEDGWLHTFAVWFDLHLTDKIKITTNPKDEKCVTCWEQAIFHTKHPIYVTKDEVVELKVSVEDSQLIFEPVKPFRKCQCYEVTKEIVTFLNDDLLIETIAKVADKYTDPELQIVDLNVFPLFGFLMAQKGCKVHHVYYQPNDLNLFEKIIEINGINPENMVFIDRLNAAECLTITDPVNIVFVDPVKTDGSLTKNLIPIDKNNLGNTIVLPETTYLRLQLSQSCYTDYCNKVKDENALNFNIAKHMNEYTGTEHPNLPFINTCPLSAVVSFKNGFIYEKTLEIPVKFKGQLNAIFYWFEIKYTDNISISTTRSTHYRKSCAIVEKPVLVEPGGVVKVNVKREDNYLKLMVVD